MEERELSRLRELSRQRKEGSILQEHRQEHADLRLMRINELAARHKDGSITVEERQERELLRQEYLEDFRINMRGILENTKIQYPDGTRKPLSKKQQ